MTASKALSTEQLINELQTRGVRLEDAGHGAPSRRGGAGPSDHKALSIDGRVVMIPVHPHRFISRSRWSPGRSSLRYNRHGPLTRAYRRMP